MFPHQNIHKYTWWDDSQSEDTEIWDQRKQAEVHLLQEPYEIREIIWTIKFLDNSSLLCFKDI
jgi:hypothetical protein